MRASIRVGLAMRLEVIACTRNYQLAVRGRQKSVFAGESLVSLLATMLLLKWHNA